MITTNIVTSKLYNIDQINNISIHNTAVKNENNDNKNNHSKFPKAEYLHTILQETKRRRLLNPKEQFR